MMLEDKASVMVARHFESRSRSNPGVEAATTSRLFATGLCRLPEKSSSETRQRHRERTRPTPQPQSRATTLPQPLRPTALHLPPNPKNGSSPPQASPPGAAPPQSPPGSKLTNRRAHSLLRQTALFNFQSLLLVILLLICTSTYVHAVAPGIMDRNKDG